ncbi:MAG: HAD-IIB family hydrolase [Ruaniaceae bacterium]|nr:HAD-IIB family hydrolase [Ruaniaceae bacterium]
MDLRLVAFDLDDTLAHSKSALPADVGHELVALLDVVDVCVISGGKWGQFEQQLLGNLPPARLEGLHLMPTCGTRYLTWTDGEWRPVYEHTLPQEQREHVAAVIEREARRLGVWEAETWGDVIEDRGTQVTFSALGQKAPLDAKRAWDPTGEKRIALKDAIAPHLPGLEPRAGGSTSVDVTADGVDKAFGIRKLAEFTGIPLADMVFVGDRLDPDGNDRPVLEMGVECVATSGPEETPAIIRALIERATR